MRIQSQLGILLTGTAALASLIGCSGGGIGNPMSNLAQAGGAGAGAAGQSVRVNGASGATGQSVTRNAVLSYSVLRPDLQRLIQKAGGLDALRAQAPAPGCRKPPFDFISDYSNNVVYQLRRPTPTTLALCAVLAGPPFSNPQGIATDRQNNLYVADTASSTILKYAPPYNGTPFVMKDPGMYPVDVAVDPKGDVAVTNIESTNGTAGNVVLYFVGSQLPTGSAQNASFTSPRFAAFDRSNKLYLDDYDLFNTGVVNVGRINPNFGSFSNAITTMTTANAIGFPGGVQVSNANKPAILDQNGGLIYAYPPTPGTNLGTPLTTTIAGSSDPVGYAFYAGSNLTLEADAGLASALLNKYSLGTLLDQLLFNGSLPIGAGTVPTEQY